MAGEKTEKNETPATAPERKHKATYATDKRKGGYLIRVIGPHAAEFTGRQVPVTRRDDTESFETLGKLVWTGKDEGTKENPGTGKPAALYQFAPRPRDEDVIAF